MKKRLAIPVLILCVAIVAAVFAVWATALEPADLGELSALYDAYDAAEGDAKIEAFKKISEYESTHDKVPEAAEGDENYGLYQSYLSRSNALNGTVEGMFSAFHAYSIAKSDEDKAEAYAAIDLYAKTHRTIPTTADGYVAMSTARRSLDANMKSYDKRTAASLTDIIALYDAYDAAENKTAAFTAIMEYEAAHKLPARVSEGAADYAGYQSYLTRSAALDVSVSEINELIKTYRNAMSFNQLTEAHTALNGYVGLHRTLNTWDDVNASEVTANVTGVNSDYTNQLSLPEAILAEADALLDDYDAAKTAHSKKYALNLYYNYFKTHRLVDKTTEAYKTLFAREETILAAHNALIAELLERDRLALAAKTPISEYGDTYPRLVYNFEGGMPSSGGSLYLHNFGGNVNKTVVKTDPTNPDNKYLSWEYTNDSGNQVHSYFQPTVKGPTGIVIDLDVTSFTYFPTIFSIYGAQNPRFPSFVKICGNTLKILDRGCVDPAYQPNVAADEGDGQFYRVIPAAFREGEWTHLTVCYYQNGSDDILNVYLDYELVSSMKFRYNSTHKFPDTSSIPVRMGDRPNDGSSIAFDNMSFYNGTSYRDPDFLTKEFGDGQKLFNFYFSWIENEDAAMGDRLLAYDYVTSNLDSFYEKDEAGNILTDDDGNKIFMEGTESVQDNIRYFENDFDSNAFMQKAYTYYTGILGERVKEIEALSAGTARTIDNATTRQDLVSACRGFVNSGKFDVMNSTYIDLIDRLNAEDNKAQNDMNVMTFVSKVNKIKSAFTLAMKKTLYVSAKEVYSTVDITPLMHIKAVADAVDFYDNFDSYSQAVEREENSDNFVYYMQKISIYKTEEEWAENYDFMSRFINLARRIVTSGNYDAQYAGLADAMVIYNRMNPYFWERIQQDHRAWLADIYDKINNSTEYIEKLGYLTSFDFYLSDNAASIEKNDDTIKTYIRFIEDCRKDLDIQREDYKKVLDQNTTLFKNYVSQMIAAPDYTALKIAYDNARACYYAMNADGDGVAEAIAAFENYRDYVDKAELAITMLPGIVNELRAAASGTLGEYFALLAEGYRYYIYLDTSITAIADSVSDYAAALTAYAGMVGIANSEMNNAQSAVSSVEGVGAPANIAAALGKLFN